MSYSVTSAHHYFKGPWLLDPAQALVIEYINKEASVLLYPAPVFQIF